MKGSKLIASCPYCGANILRSQGGDMEIKCVRCKKDLHIRVYAEKILVAANSPHEGAVMVAEESVQYGA